MILLQYVYTSVIVLKFSLFIHSQNYLFINDTIIVYLYTNMILLSSFIFLRVGPTQSSMILTHYIHNSMIIFINEQSFKEKID